MDGDRELVAVGGLLREALVGSEQVVGQRGQRRGQPGGERLGAVVGDGGGGGEGAAKEESVEAGCRFDRGQAVGGR